MCHWSICEQDDEVTVIAINWSCMMKKEMSLKRSGKVFGLNKPVLSAVQPNEPIVKIYQ